MTKEDILIALRTTEWANIEFKEASQGLPKSIWDTVSAFSNSSGGWILLGVRETMVNKKTVFEISGVENSEKLSQEFIGVLRSKTKFNIVITPQCEKFQFDGKEVLAFYIPQATIKPVYFNSIANTFIRSGSGDQRATDLELAALLRESDYGRRSEQAVIGTTLSDLSINSLSTYRNTLRVVNPDYAYNGLTDEDFCKKSGIMTPNGSLTIGGLLMFGKRESIDKFNPNFWIDYIEIPGTSLSDAQTRYTFRLQEQDNIWESYNIIIRRLRTYVDTPYSPRNDGYAPENESLLYCLREALVNLCAHCDYFANAHPTIRAFTDKISFQNPGTFPFDVSMVSKLPIQSNPRNPIIIRLFRLVKLSENGGYGIDKILKWETLTRRTVKFESYSDFANVTFSLPNNGEESGEISGEEMEKSSLMHRIVSLLTDEPTCRRQDAIETLKVSSRTYDRAIKALKDSKTILRVGGNKNGYWVVVGKYGAKSSPNNGEISGEEGEKTSLMHRIVSLLTDEPTCRRQDAIEKLRVSSRTYDRAIKVLKETNVIKRVGGVKNGYWVITKQASR